MDEGMEKRIKLAVQLMRALKDQRDHIGSLTKTIGESSDDALSKVYETNQEKIREKVELFNGNVAEALNACARITETMNDWHAFTGDEAEQGRLLFPLRLMKRRREAKKSIQRCKEMINSLTIKNRLIREDIIRLESTLELEATKRLCEGAGYRDYSAHIEQKAFLIDALQYLLPTIPDLPFTEINVDTIERQMEVLSRMCG